MKKKKNSVVEQVMDDLCQEMQSSLEVSSADAMEMINTLEPAHQQEEGDIDSLIYFQPRKSPPKEEEVKEEKNLEKKGGIKKEKR